MKRIVCLAAALALFLSLTPGISLGEGQGALCLRPVPGYTAPDVPQSEAVDDDYFQDAILVGDSVASGFELYGYWQGIESFCHIGASPKGAALHACFTMDGADVTLKQVLQERKPQKIYLMLGANGLAVGTAQYTLKGYETLLDLVIETCPDAVVYCLSATPISRTVKDRYDNFTKGRVTVFNTGLYDLAKQRGAFYIDLHSALVAGNGYIDRQWGAGDGIHIRSAAYARLEDVILTHTVKLPEDWVMAPPEDDALVPVAE